MSDYGKGKPPPPYRVVSRGEIPLYKIQVQEVRTDQESKSK
jgi:hypothetical protein